MLDANFKDENTGSAFLPAPLGLRVVNGAASQISSTTAGSTLISSGPSDMLEDSVLSARVGGDDKGLDLGWDGIPEREGVNLKTQQISYDRYGDVWYKDSASLEPEPGLDQLPSTMVTNSIPPSMRSAPLPSFLPSNHHPYHGLDADEDIVDVDVLALPTPPQSAPRLNVANNLRHRRAQSIQSAVSRSESEWTDDRGDENEEDCLSVFSFVDEEGGLEPSSDQLRERWEDAAGSMAGDISRLTTPSFRRSEVGSILRSTVQPTFEVLSRPQAASTSNKELFSSSGAREGLAERVQLSDGPLDREEGAWRPQFSKIAEHYSANPLAPPDVAKINVGKSLPTPNASNADYFSPTVTSPFARRRTKKGLRVGGGGSVSTSIDSAQLTMPDNSKLLPDASTTSGAMSRSRSVSSTRRDRGLYVPPAINVLSNLSPDATLSQTPTPFSGSSSSTAMHEDHNMIERRPLKLPPSHRNDLQSPTYKTKPIEDVEQDIDPSNPSNNVTSSKDFRVPFQRVFSRQPASETSSSSDFLQSQESVMSSSKVFTPPQTLHAPNLLEVLLPLQKRLDAIITTQVTSGEIAVNSVSAGDGVEILRGSVDELHNKMDEALGMLDSLISMPNQDIEPLASQAMGRRQVEDMGMRVEELKAMLLEAKGPSSHVQEAQSTSEGALQLEIIGKLDAVLHKLSEPSSQLPTSSHDILRSSLFDPVTDSEATREYAQPLQTSGSSSHFLTNHAEVLDAIIQKIDQLQLGHPSYGSSGSRVSAPVSECGPRQDSDLGSRNNQGISDLHAKLDQLLYLCQQNATRVSDPQAGFNFQANTHHDHSPTFVDDGEGFIAPSPINLNTPRPAWIDDALTTADLRDNFPQSQEDHSVDKNTRTNSGVSTSADDGGEGVDRVSS